MVFVDTDLFSDRDPCASGMSSLLNIYSPRWTKSTNKVMQTLTILWIYSNITWRGWEVVTHFAGGVNRRLISCFKISAG
jgi:hypothetical protein